MSKTGQNSKGAPARRKVKSSTVRSRKNVRSPAKTGVEPVKSSALASETLNTPKSPTSVSESPNVAKSSKTPEIIFDTNQKPLEDAISSAKKSGSPQIILKASGSSSLEDSILSAKSSNFTKPIPILHWSDLNSASLETPIFSPEPLTLVSELSATPSTSLASKSVTTAPESATKSSLSIPINSKISQAEPVKSSAPAYVSIPVKSVSAQTSSQIDLSSVHSKMRARSESKPVKKRLSAAEIKEREIKKAVYSASRSKPAKKSTKTILRSSAFSWPRIVLALSSAAVLVFAVVYFVNLSTPDVSLKVAAMQTGIDASYPSYVPRGFSLSDITSENGRITLNFKSSADNTAYSLVEEKSSWDSNALFTNYVKPEFGDNYTTLREQGITIYVSKSNAAWVNGGIVYRLTTTSGSLTKKQITNIATSL